MNKKHGHPDNGEKLNTWWAKNKNMLLIIAVVVLFFYSIAMTFKEGSVRGNQKDVLMDCKADPSCTRAVVDYLSDEPPRPTNSFGEFKSFKSFDSF